METSYLVIGHDVILAIISKKNGELGQKATENYEDGHSSFSNPIICQITIIYVKCSSSFGSSI